MEGERGGRGRRGIRETKRKEETRTKNTLQNKIEERKKRVTMPLFESCFSELRVDGRRLYLKGVNWFGFEVNIVSISNLLRKKRGGGAEAFALHERGRSFVSLDLARST